MKKQIAKRQCIVTGSSLDVGQGLAFFIDKEGALSFSHKAPNQKVMMPSTNKPVVLWVKFDYEVVKQFLGHLNLYAQDFEQAKKTDDYINRILFFLKQRSLQTMGMMKKAGLILTGYGKIEGFCKSQKGTHKILGLVFATDGSLRECHNLLASFPEGAYCVSLFKAEELGKALGLERVVYASFMRHKLSETFLTSVKQLADFLQKMPQPEQQCLPQE